MTFARPELLWWIALAPVAALGAALLWRRLLQDISRWAGRELWPRLFPGYRIGRLGLHVVLLAVGTGSVALALAGPRWGVTEEAVERRGIDVVLVVDTSLSMSATDVAPDRLGVAKALVQRLLQELPGDRIGLVQAEGEGQVLAPLTLDRGVVDLLLESLETASLPTPGTRLARGLERALEVLSPETSGTRAVILVSDGEDHGEDHQEILRELRRRGVTVHTLAVGTVEGAYLPLPGSRDGYKRDREGQPVLSRIQTEWLRELSQATGGVHLQASGGGRSLDPLVETLRGSDEGATGTEVVRQETERFQWFLALALLSTLGLLFLRPFAPEEPAS